VNEPVSWICYSLAGQENVTITGNTTLSGLSSSLHNVTVYAKDEFGNTGTSQTISFKITEPSPKAIVATTSGASAVIVATVVVVAGLLVYFKKRKH